MLAVPSGKRERVENNHGAAAQQAPGVPVFGFQLFVGQNRFVGTENGLSGCGNGFRLFRLENRFIQNEALDAEDAEGDTQSNKESPPHGSPPKRLHKRNLLPHAIGNQT
jgi:hypothetical protein